MIELIVQLQVDAFRCNAATSSTSASTKWEWAKTILCECIFRLRFGLEDVERLCIRSTQRVAEVVAGRSRVAIGLVCGVVASNVGGLIEVYCRQIGVATAAVAIVDVCPYGHVATFIAKTTVELQLRTDVLIAAVRHRFVLLTVDYQSFVIHLFKSFLTQRVGDVVEGISIERRRPAIAAAVACGKTQVRTERKRRQRIDGPLQVHVARPAVVA